MTAVLRFVRNCRACGHGSHICRPGGCIGFYIGRGFDACHCSEADYKLIPLPMGEDVDDRAILIR